MPELITARLVGRPHLAVPLQAFGCEGQAAKIKPMALIQVADAYRGQRAQTVVRQRPGPPLKPASGAARRPPRGG